MTVTAARGTAAGTYVLPFVGTGGGISHSNSITVSVSTVDWQQFADARLIPKDNGDVYGTIATYVQGADANSITNRTLSARMTGPTGLFYGPADASETTGSTRSAVSSPDFNLASRGFGAYSFSWTSLYYYGSTRVGGGDSLTTTRTYPTPSIRTLSTSSGIPGTSPTVMIEGAGLTIPDLTLRSPQVYKGATNVNINGPLPGTGPASGITASVTSQTSEKLADYSSTTVTASFNIFNIASNATPGSYNVNLTLLRTP